MNKSSYLSEWGLGVRSGSKAFPYISSHFELGTPWMHYKIKAFKEGECVLEEEREGGGNNRARGSAPTWAAPPPSVPAHSLESRADKLGLCRKRTRT